MMYEATRIARLKTIKDRMNEHPLLKEVTKGMDLTVLETATDGPLCFFIWIKEGQVLEFSEERKPADIYFSAPMEMWKKFVTGEKSFVTSLFDREAKVRANFDLNKFPELKKIVGDIDTSFALVEPETRNASIVHLTGGHVKMWILRDVNTDPEEEKTLAENVVEASRSLGEKVLRGKSMISLVPAVLRGKVKVRTGFRKLLKYRKLSKALELTKTVGLIEEFSKWLPIREMA